MWLALRNKRRLLKKLVGTAGSWFLFDVTFYGNQLVSRYDIGIEWQRLPVALITIGLLSVVATDSIECCAY